MIAHPEGPRHTYIEEFRYCFIHFNMTETILKIIMWHLLSFTYKIIGKCLMEKLVFTYNRLHYWLKFISISFFCYLVLFFSSFVFFLQLQVRESRIFVWGSWTLGLLTFFLCLSGWRFGRWQLGFNSTECRRCETSQTNQWKLAKHSHGILNETTIGKSIFKIIV